MQKLPEFGEQLPIGKAKLEFLVNEQGMISMRMSGSGFMAMYQIAVAYPSGIPLAVVPFTGIGAPLPPYPKPSLLAWIMSDELGMWGRICPFCRTYFRSNHIMDATICPYCGSLSDSLQFITEAQGRYVAAFCNAYIEAGQKKSSITIDLETVTDSKPEWKYAEERQQFHFKCLNCETETDILGEYGWCPKCGKTNAREIINAKLKQLEEGFDKADKAIADKAERSQQWEEINSKCFSGFEALGRHLQTILAKLPATPSRKKEVEGLSFQRLLEAAECLKQWYGVDIFKNVSPDDQGFLNLMLNQRHIIEHNGGKVDQKYLNQSGDKKARLNERISIGSNRIRHLLPVMCAISTNLLDGFESLK
jgi:Zn finger protein HypA/HybF involved in hydrogenase expression